ncbi:hypothetical protein PENTCL1PPCAC_1758 [Pristionchus entomophagus]|uniref:Uncharacterized protein n=1 Tax=Pristionchus entomophagus TaxID=358040 RepID=A0AAV5SBP3_9BILA|nr:hypothetical protein PENTCL1PPCAC_1758 [Pristionchus entomophagus]
MILNVHSVPIMIMMWLEDKNESSKWSDSFRPSWYFSVDQELTTTIITNHIREENFTYSFDDGFHLIQSNNNGLLAAITTNHYGVDGGRDRMHTVRVRFDERRL